ncbi:MAG: CsbD family protein [Desulfobacteraceae bacterium]|nr:MAG: CsbD family protein [Desulfobacteraceae bacterium]
MKSSTKDKAEGKLHQIKGTIKEVAGIIAGNDDLEAKGKEENLEGKIQEKIGQIKKVVNK